MHGTDKLYIAKSRLACTRLGTDRSFASKLMMMAIQASRRSWAKFIASESFDFMHRHALQTPQKQGPFGDTSFGGVALILGRIVPVAFDRLKTMP